MEVSVRSIQHSANNMHRGSRAPDGRGVFHEIGLIGMLLGEISGPSALVKAGECGDKSRLKLRVERKKPDPGAIRNNRKTQMNSVWFYCSRRIPHDGRLRRRLLRAGMVRPSVFSGSPSLELPVSQGLVSLEIPKGEHFPWYSRPGSGRPRMHVVPTSDRGTQTESDFPGSTGSLRLK
jgi:hypothetical protein